MSNLKDELGTVVRQRRENQGLSQEEFALIAGVHRTHLSKVELGKVNARLDVLAKIASVFHIPLSQLIAEAEAILRKKTEEETNGYG